MKQFLFCSTVFSRKQYTVLNYERKDDCVEKLNYLLTHRQDAVIWPLFVKSDVEEMLSMDQSLVKVLRGITVGSDKCRIRYNGKIYEVDEISASNIIDHYWKVISKGETYLLDPDSIEIL